MLVPVPLATKPVSHSVPIAAFKRAGELFIVVIVSVGDHGPPVGEALAACVALVGFGFLSTGTHRTVLKAVCQNLRRGIID